MFAGEDILYEDNHLLIINKKGGELVQTDTEGSIALENEIKSFIKIRDHKPGGVFLGVVHRIDRPVSGAVVFAKTSKALARMNELIKDRKIDKRYWAVVEKIPETIEGSLTHYILRDRKNNRSKACASPIKDAKKGELNYRLIGSSNNYHLMEVELITGRHHQIRAQLSSIGCPIKGDLKYGAPRSNPNGNISLHSRSLEFKHPVTKEQIKIIAPVPQDDNLWIFFEKAMK